LNLKLWLKRILATVLLVSGFLIILGEDFGLENAPTQYSGPGSYTEEERVALQATALLVSAAIALCLSSLSFFFGLLLLLKKPSLPMTARHPKLSRMFYHLAIFIAALMTAWLLSAAVLHALIDRKLLPGKAEYAQTAGTQILATLAVFSFALYRACRLPTATSALTEDRRPPFVYIRSFREEKRYRLRADVGGLEKLLRVFSTYAGGLESVVANAVQDYGPLVALSRPGQLIPVDGAARDSVGNDDWQSRITSFLTAARAVFVVPGKTPGLAWEVCWLHSANMLYKLVILLPPGLRFLNRKPWHAFCSATHLATFLELPSEDEVLSSVLLYVKNSKLVAKQGKRNARGYHSAIAGYLRELATRDGEESTK